jgi:hypothetical protein
LDAKVKTPRFSVIDYILHHEQALKIIERADELALEKCKNK